VAGQIASCDLGFAEEELLPLEDDECLLQGLREGAEPAYEALIQRYQQPVYNLVARLLRDPGEACDVVQEVFLKVFRRIGCFRGDSKLKTWIYRIAVNEAHNHCRWNGRHRGQEVGLEGSEDCRNYSDILSAPGDSPYDYVLGRENHHLVEAAFLGAPVDGVLSQGVQHEIHGCIELAPRSRDVPKLVIPLAPLKALLGGSYQGIPTSFDIH